MKVTAASFVQVKKLGASVGYGGDWTVRIAAMEREADGSDSEAPQRISLIFYVADEDVSEPSILFRCLWLRLAAARQTCKRGFLAGTAQAQL